MAFSLSLLSLSLLPGLLQSRAAALPPRPIERRAAQLQSVAFQAFQEPSPDVVTPNYLSLTRGDAKSHSFATLSALQRGRAIEDVERLVRRQSGASAPLTSLGGIEYLVDITFGTETVSVILDTGSSDTWLIKSGFTCTDASGTKQPASTCNFGPTYNGTYTVVPNENFSISYGDGEFVTGTIGTQDITIAGITVPKQTSALGTSAYWRGNGVSSGLLGLAYPAITSAFSGTNPSQDSSSTQVQYDPIFTTMYKKNLSAPTFSLAIQRDGASSGGYIAFGGLPPVSTDNSTFASTPIQILTSQGGSSDSFYTITPDALVYKGAATSNSEQYIVDSGTSLTYLPTAVASAVAKLFSPKATYDSSQGAYFVSCTATAPSFGVKIGGTTFTLSPKDLILQGQKDTTSGKCLLGLTDGSSGPYILGDTFLANVVAVFDVGAAEMRFGAHSY